ncbi:MAG: hypothetical protein LBS86_07385 [Treponema sp.]|nr:hypothetical protein [Treponema sp.]
MTALSGGAVGSTSAVIKPPVKALRHPVAAPVEATCLTTCPFDRLSDRASNPRDSASSLNDRASTGGGE